LIGRHIYFSALIHAGINTKYLKASYYARMSSCAEMKRTLLVVHAS
jgi:hypothetical protein